MVHIRLTVNGFSRELLVEPHEMLIFTLRERLNLTGTKQGCDQGSCGSCTVHLDGKPVLSCITASVKCDGKSVRTLEDIAAGGSLHPIQRQLVDKGAIQCGYCTPGIVMTSISLLERNPHPTEAEIREGLSGNLCRCTGYSKIVEAIAAAAKEIER